MITRHQDKKTRFIQLATCQYTAKQPFILMTKTKKNWNEFSLRPPDKEVRRILKGQLFNCLRNLQASDGRFQGLQQTMNNVLFALKRNKIYPSSGLSMIVHVNVVLNRTVVDNDGNVSTTCAGVIFRDKVSCITSLEGIKLGYWPDWSIKSQCY